MVFFLQYLIYLYLEVFDLNINCFEYYIIGNNLDNMTINQKTRTSKGTWTIHDLPKPEPMGQTFTHNSCAEWKEIWQSLCLGGPETRLATVGCLPVTASDSWVPHPPGTGPSRYKLHFTSAYINISTGNQAIVLSPGCSITTTSRRGSSNSDNRFLADVKNSWGSPHIFLQFLSPEKAALLSDLVVFYFFSLLIYSDLDFQ